MGYITRHTYTEDGTNYLYPFVRTDCIYAPSTGASGVDSATRGGAAIASALSGIKLNGLLGLGVITGNGGTLTISDTDETNTDISAATSTLNITARTSAEINAVQLDLITDKLVICNETKCGYIYKSSTSDDKYTANLYLSALNLTGSSIVLSSDTVGIVNSSTVNFTTGTSANFRSGSSLIADNGATVQFNNTPIFKNGVKIDGGSLTLNTTFTSDVLGSIISNVASDTSKYIFKTILSSDTSRALFNVYWDIDFGSGDDGGVSIDCEGQITLLHPGTTGRTLLDGTSITLYPSSSTYSTKRCYMSNNLYEQYNTYGTKNQKIKLSTTKAPTLQLLESTSITIPEISAPNILFYNATVNQFVCSIREYSSTLKNTFSFERYNGSSLYGSCFNIEFYNEDEIQVFSTNGKMKIYSGTSSILLEGNGTVRCGDVAIYSLPVHLIDSNTSGSTIYNYATDDIPEGTTHIHIYAEKKEKTTYGTTLKFGMDKLKLGQVVYVMMEGQGQNATDETVYIECATSTGTATYTISGCDSRQKVLTATIVGMKYSKTSNIIPVIVGHESY